MLRERNRGRKRERGAIGVLLSSIPKILECIERATCECRFRGELDVHRYGEMLKNNVRVRIDAFSVLETILILVSVYLLLLKIQYI